MSDSVAAPAQQSSTGRATALDHFTAGTLASTSVYQLAVHYHHDSVGDMENVLHFQADTEPSGEIGDVLDDLIQAYLDATQDLILPMLGSDSQLSGYLARRITQGSPTVSEFVGLAGTASSVIDNTAIACNIAFLPGSAPWHYGHFYVPCVPDSQFAQNNFLAPYLLKADALAAALTGSMSHTGGSLGLHWRVVIYNRKTSTARPITRYLRQSRPVSIGRRLRPWFTGF